MSILDEKGEPLAYGWNDEAAAERRKHDPQVMLIEDQEFERRFPHLFENKLEKTRE